MALNPNAVKIAISADNRTKAGIDSVKRSLGQVESAAIGVGRTLGVAFAGVSVAGFIAAIDKSIDRMDAAYEAAQKIGTTTENYTALEFAFEQSGLSAEQLKSSMVKLSKAIVDARDPASASAEAFRRLEIDPSKFDDPVDALKVLADRFATLPDGIDKTALAAEIFGKRVGPDLLPLLNAGSAGINELMKEAERLGIVFGDDIGKKADEFKDSVGALKEQAVGLAIDIATELLPTLLEIVRALKGSGDEAETGGRKFSILRTVLETVAVLGANIAFVFGRIGGGIAAIAAAGVNAAQGNFAAARDIMREYSKDSEQARRDLDAFEKRVLNPPAPDAAARANKQALKAALEDQKLLRAESKKSVTEQISDANRLRDALIKAYADAGKSAKDYFTQAKALRDRANAKDAPDADDVEGQALAMLDLLAAEAKLQRIRAEAPLEDVQAQAELVRELAARLGDQARAKEALKNADLAEADALERAGNQQLELQKGLAEQQKLNDQRLVEFVAKLEQLEKGIVIPVSLDTSQADAQIRDLAGSSATAPGYADGGRIRGPGSGTSDSILARLSNGEFVMRAAAVQHYGADFLNRLNRMTLPRFADGGAVSRLSLPAAPSLSTGPSSIVNLTLPGGGTFEMRAQESVAAALQKAVSRAALMHGRRR